MYWKPRVPSRGPPTGAGLSPKFKVPKLTSLSASWNCVPRPVLGSKLWHSGVPAGTVSVERAEPAEVAGHDRGLGATGGEKGSRNAGETEGSSSPRPPEHGRAITAGALSSSRDPTSRIHHDVEYNSTGLDNFHRPVQNRTDTELNAARCALMAQLGSKNIHSCGSTHGNIRAC